MRVLRGVQLACELFGQTHEKLHKSGAASREIADEILRAKENRMKSPEP
jgi:hypothetical protein